MACLTFREFLVWRPSTDSGSPPELWSSPYFDLELTSLGILKHCKVLPRPTQKSHLKLRTESIDDSHIQYLPRALKTLYLANAHALTSNCVAHFPDLDYLSLSSSFQIKRSSLPDFPYTLRSRQRGITVSIARWYIIDGEIVEDDSPIGGETPEQWPVVF